MGETFLNIPSNVAGTSPGSGRCHRAVACPLSGKLPIPKIISKEHIMAIQPIPEGYHAVTPYLTVRGADRVIEFLKRAFNAEMTHEPMKRPDGSIMHAEVQIGDSRVMIGEESEQSKATSSTLYLYVPDVDSVYQRAVKAGGKTVMEPADMFYGDRCGGVKDASGNSWMMATHKEDVPMPELKRRAEAFMKQQKPKDAAA
jgi:uncharacterized glyoxalase superfamily protein PhnB